MPEPSEGHYTTTIPLSSVWSIESCFNLPQKMSYRDYFDFSKKNGLHRKPDNIFGRDLPDEIVKDRKKVKGDRENYYLGIRLKQKLLVDRAEQ
jgi:hypothetical protein